MSTKVKVQGRNINLLANDAGEYISLTDIAKYRNPDAPADIVKNWLRSRATIGFLGLWERLNNPDFKLVEFDQFKTEAGSNYFVLSPQRWITETSAIGLISRSGRYGGTFAHQDIAFEFASWISPEFKLYLIKEFQRLKEKEEKQLGWNVKRNLAKINYRIHTAAIKENLIPPELTSRQISLVYATEADVLNMALFGITAKEWRQKNSGIKGNMRDFSNVSQLVCLSNLESLNAHFIHEKASQSERLRKLNQIAIQQMRLLTDDDAIKRLRVGKRN